MCWGDSHFPGRPPELLGHGAVLRQAGTRITGRGRLGGLVGTVGASARSVQTGGDRQAGLLHFAGRSTPHTATGRFND